MPPKAAPHAARGQGAHSGPLDAFPASALPPVWRLTTLPARCSGRGALLPPIALPVGRPTSRVWAHERATAPPCSSPTSLGAGAPTWAAGWTPMPHTIPSGRCGSPASARFRAPPVHLRPAGHARQARIGPGLWPRQRLRREGGTAAVLPDCPAQSRATVRQSASQTRPGAPRAYSPGPWRAAASVRDLARLADWRVWRSGRNTQEERRHKQHATPHAEAGIR